MLKKVLLFLSALFFISFYAPTDANAACWQVETGPRGPSCVEDSECSPDPNLGRFDSQESCTTKLNNPTSCWARVLNNPRLTGDAQCVEQNVYTPSCSGGTNFPTRDECISGQLAPTVVPGAPQESGAPIELIPSPEEITGDIPSVKIIFRGLEPGKKWHICSRTDGCGSAKDNASVESDGTLTLTVCGAGDERLQRDGYNGGDEESCDENDFFHEGKVYAITLFQEETQERRGPSIKFYVNHFYPDVTVSASNTPVEVVISGTKLPPPDNKGFENRNNYQVVMEGTDIYGNRRKFVQCTSIKPNEESTTVRFGNERIDDPNPLWSGNYLIKVNEQVNESGIRGGFDDCNGGYTFWHIDVNIDKNGNMAPLETTCLGTAEENPTECDKDPNDSDIKGFNKLMKELGFITTFDIKCSKFEYNEKHEVECLEINTAIGSMPTDPIAFIQRLFSIVLTLAGIAALILLIYGGYTYMISRGDPERVKGARETITSAIFGLLFIIFSFVILQVIVGDILRVPGFNDPDEELNLETGVDRVDDGTIPGGELNEGGVR